MNYFLSCLIFLLFYLPFVSFFIFITLHVFFYKQNAYKHTQPEIKDIFKHKLSIIASTGKLLINFFRGNCYVSIKYDLIGN